MRPRNDTMRKPNKEKHRYKKVGCEKPWDNSWQTSRYKSKGEMAQIHNAYSYIFSGSTRVIHEESPMQNNDALRNSTSQNLKINDEIIDTRKVGEQLPSSSPSAIDPRLPTPEKRSLCSTTLRVLSACLILVYTNQPKPSRIQIR